MVYIDDIYTIYIYIEATTDVVDVVVAALNLI